MDISVFNKLPELDQYIRLDLAQQHLSEIQGEHIENMLRIAQDSLKGNFETAFGVSELAILCAIALDDQIILSKALIAHARLLFSIGDNQTAIHYSLQAFNCLRLNYQYLNEIRNFFIDQDFNFGIALLDEKIAHSLEPIAAVNLLERVEVIYNKCNYQLGLGYVYWIKGGAYKVLYRLEDAFTAYMHALQILSQYEMHVAELLLDLSYVCAQVNQLDEAQLYLEKAEKIYQEEKNELGLVAIDLNKATFSRRKGENPNFVRLYRQAYFTYQKHNQIENAAFVEMEVATLLLRYPRHQDQSIVFLKSAISTFVEAGNKQLTAKARGYLAILYYSNGEYVKAKKLLIEIIDGNHLDIPSDTLWQSFYYLGVIELSEGNLVKSYEHYQNALEIIEQMRAHLRTEELIIDFLDLKPNFYEPLVLIAKELRRIIEAIYWIEQSKSRAFIHLLGNTKFSYHSTNDAGLLNQLNELDTQIAILDKTMDSRRTLESTKIINTWHHIRSEKISRREQLSRELKIRNAEMASLVNVQSIGWEEIKDVLNK